MSDNAAAIRRLDEWLADDSGEQERSWAALQKRLGVDEAALLARQRKRLMWQLQMRAMWLAIDDLEQIIASMAQEIQDAIVQVFSLDDEP